LKETADKIIGVLSETAQKWLDFDYPVRKDAIDRSLEAKNRFTEAAVVFAINQQMSLLTKAALQTWQEQLGWNEKQSVGVLNPGNIPFVEIQDFVATVLSGRTYLGTVSAKSPALFPAFLSDLLESYPELRADITDLDEVLESCDILIASGSNETVNKIAKRATEAGIGESHRWMRGHRYSMAVLDGRESSDELIALAEDALLHEGLGCRNVALIFAPSTMEIDPVLESFATFRGSFEAHSATIGSLKMQQAFLKAVSTPHAYADGHQFLISRGDAELQQPGHLRWISYESLETVSQWIMDRKNDLQCVISAKRLKQRLDGAEDIGSAQRPELDWAPDGKTHVQFFRHQSSNSGV